MKFTVYRDKWARGNGAGSLLDDQGKMCCLGFLGRQCGIEKEDIKHVGMPSETVKGPWPDGIVYKDEEYGCVRDTSACNFIATTNDSVGIETTEELRERILTDEFSRIGIEVEFVDGSGPY